MVKMFKASVKRGKKGELSDLDGCWAGVTIGLQTTAQKEEISSLQQSCGRKFLADVRGHRRIGRLVPAAILR